VQLAASVVSSVMVAFMLLSFPSRHCIRHAAQLGCIWRYDTELAVRPVASLPCQILDAFGAVIITLKLYIIEA
jgi:hypothetical protein